MLGLTGSRKTRRYAPQTAYDSFSRQPCATRPRRRGVLVRASASFCVGARHAVPVSRYQRLSRHSRVGGNPEWYQTVNWIPAYAGMTWSGLGRPGSGSAMTLHGGSLVERELDRPVCVVLITEKRGECARPKFPFTRASSAGLAGRRAAACLRLAEPSSAAPRQTEQRCEPEGPRSRVPRGIAKGGWASSPPWLAGEGETGTPSRHR